MDSRKKPLAPIQHAIIRPRGARTMSMNTAVASRPTTPARQNTFIHGPTEVPALTLARGETCPGSFMTTSLQQAGRGEGAEQLGETPPPTLHDFRKVNVSVFGWSFRFSANAVRE